MSAGWGSGAPYLLGGLVVGVHHAGISGSDGIRHASFTHVQSIRARGYKIAASSP